MNGKIPSGGIFDKVALVATSGQLFETDGFIDIRGLYEEMVTKEAIEFARKSAKIKYRYENQELRRVGGWSAYTRNHWTPAQKRRINKSLKKIGSSERV